MAYDGIETVMTGPARNSGVSTRLAAHRETNGTATGSRFANFSERVREGAQATGRRENGPVLAAPAAAATAKPAAPLLTNMDVTLARDAARKAERQRWAAVYASDASKGRERGCANLLNHPRGYSSAGILKHLASMPLDRDWMASTPGGKAHADAVWSGAYGHAPAASASEPAASPDPAGDVWAKAWERSR